MFHVQCVRDQLGCLAYLVYQKSSILTVSFNQRPVIGQNLQRRRACWVQVAAVTLNSGAVGLEQFKRLSQGVEDSRQ